jgi:uncharacterized membrane protein
MSASGRSLLAAQLVAAVAGIGIALYLTVVHYSNVPLACSTTGPVDCGAVTHSSFSVVPGTAVPITIPGVLWFAVTGLASLAALAYRPPRWLAGAQVGWALLGLASVLYLVYAELVVIHRICEWCTGVHILILVSFVLSLRRWQLIAAADHA